MAARTTKSAKTKATSTPKPKRVVRKKTAPTSDLELYTKTSSVSKNRNIDFKKKVVIAGGVLLAAFLIYSAKDLFIAATVNGYPVSRLEVVRELEKQGGEQVLESLVNEKIILQEARKANITITDEDVNAKVNQFKEQLSAQGQEYNAILEAQGVSEADFKKQVEIQVYLEKMLADKTTVTEEEIKTFLEENTAYMPEGLSDEEKRNMAMEELKQQKLSTEFSNWLTEAKANAKVNYFVEY